MPKLTETQIREIITREVDAVLQGSREGSREVVLRETADATALRESAELREQEIVGLMREGHTREGAEFATRVSEERRLASHDDGWRPWRGGPAWKNPALRLIEANTTLMGRILSAIKKKFPKISDELASFQAKNAAKILSMDGKTNPSDSEINTAIAGAQSDGGGDEAFRPVYDTHRFREDGTPIPSTDPQGGDGFDPQMLKSTMDVISRYRPDLRDTQLNGMACRVIVWLRAAGIRFPTEEQIVGSLMALQSAKESAGGVDDDAFHEALTGSFMRMGLSREVALRAAYGRNGQAEAEMRLAAEANGGTNSDPDSLSREIAAGFRRMGLSERQARIAALGGEAA